MLKRLKNQRPIQATYRGNYHVGPACILSLEAHQRRDSDPNLSHHNYECYTEHTVDPAVYRC